MTFVMSAMCSYTMYSIVALVARRRRSSDHLIIWLWEQDGKNPVLHGKYIYTLRLY